MKKYLTIVLILFIATSCSSQDEKQTDEQQYDSISVKLNNKAVQLSLFPNEDSIEMAILFLSKSIQQDSNYYLAYSNMASLLLKQGKSDSAIDILQTIIDRKPNYAEALSGQGYIYDKEGKHDWAEQKYKLAMKAYDNRLEKNGNDINAKVNRAFLMLFLYDKETALREINKILDEHPEDSFALTMKNDIIPYFEHNEFLNSY